jgi:hypothetical protein
MALSVTSILITVFYLLYLKKCFLSTKHKSLATSPQPAESINWRFKMEATIEQSPVLATNTAGNHNLTEVAQAVGVTSVSAIAAMTQRIADLSAEAKEFETGAYATANLALYGLVKKSYVLYKDLINPNDSELRFKKQALADYLSVNNLGAFADKPLPLRIIAAVFGNLNRRRLSSYNVALRSLIAENIAVNDVIKTIEDKGGIQEMSVKRAAGTLGAANKVTAVEEAVKATTLGSVNTPDTKQFVDQEKVGEQYTAVLTQEADGSFSINTIVDNTTALKAVLVAHYNIEKAKAKKA